MISWSMIILGELEGFRTRETSSKITLATKTPTVMAHNFEKAVFLALTGNYCS
jgi:hypothetical protein